VKVWIAHDDGPRLMGELPPGVTVEVSPAGEAAFPSDPATVEFWAPPFLSRSETVGLLGLMPAVKVVQLMSAGAEIWVDRMPAGVTLCDGRGVHDSSTAEWAAAAVLAYVRAFPGFVRAQERREWTHGPTDELAGKRVLIVGAGSIGTALAARLAPFDVSLTLVARRARPGDGVYGVDDLPDLLPHADVVVLLVPLTPLTRGLVDGGFLAALPDGALVVNGARGPVVRTDALQREVASGRLHAVLDVTDPEPLPADHPLWTMPNVFITPHVAGSVPGLRRRAYRLVGEQLRRYVAGEPLHNVVSEGY
jgi:phosphoglycerate dehydrogenase-like enzyme